MRKIPITPCLYPGTKANLKFDWVSILIDSDSFANTDIETDSDTIVLTLKKLDSLDYNFKTSK